MHFEMALRVGGFVSMMYTRLGGLGSNRAPLPLLGGREEDLEGCSTEAALKK